VFSRVGNVCKSQVTGENNAEEEDMNPGRGVYASKY
jgi:hypothetical protein